MAQLNQPKTNRLDFSTPNTNEMGFGFDEDGIPVKIDEEGNVSDFIQTDLRPTILFGGFNWEINIPSADFVIQVVSSSMNGDVVLIGNNEPVEITNVVKNLLEKTITVTLTETAMRTSWRYIALRYVVNNKDSEPLFIHNSQPRP